MTPRLLAEIWLLFGMIFVAGTLACLPAYHWQLSRFFASRLWTKVWWWLPIFIVFCAVLYGKTWAAGLVVPGLLVLALREIHARRAGRHWYVWAHLLVFAAALCHLPLFWHLHAKTAVHGLIAICFASVMSDVCAYFAGTYGGRHKLPAFINPHKAYEGVAGQITGAFLGTALVALLPEIGFSWQLALAVGLASALGDVANSIVKRRLGIADWGTTIPGHGGVLDRFASLSFALAAGFWLLTLLHT